MSSTATTNTNVADFLRILHPEGVYELRSPKCPQWKNGKVGTASGWFNDPDKAAAAIQELERTLEPPAIYVSLNVVNPVLLGRSNHKFKFGGSATGDANIVQRTGLLIDIDPARPAGTNSTDGQVAAALAKADQIELALDDLGWPSPIRGMSGNGATLIYRVNLANDAQSTELIERVLRALDAKFSDDVCHVDTAVHDAARICKVLGTMTRKGDHVVGIAGVEDMPQRRSYFVTPDRPLEVVTVDKLCNLANEVADEAKPADGKPKAGPVVLPKAGDDSQQWLDNWLAVHNVPVSDSMPYRGGRKWLFDELPPTCKASPSGHDHDNTAWLVQRADGVIQAGCRHDRCTWKWQDLRQSYEPTAYVKPKLATGTAAGPFLLDDEGRNDNHVAARFVSEHGRKLRYVPAWKCWLHWDGRRWVRDYEVGALREARLFSRRLFAKLGEIVAKHHLEKAEYAELRNFVDRCNQSGAISAIVKLAKSDQRIAVDPGQLNARPRLFNVQNGTIELNTGELREHRPDDLLTQVAAVNFDPAAACPGWEQTLRRVFGGDAELIRYMRQLLGYAMLGEATEAILPIWYGSGCNGKSTIWNAVLDILGDYALAASQELILPSRYPAPHEKAELFGRRFVCVGEPDEGRWLAESEVKQLTGNDEISACRKYEHPFNFRPTHLLTLATNHKPRIKGDDVGIWRRIKLIPFEVNLSELPNFEPVAGYSKLLVADEGPGILNWMIGGLHDYLENGFVEPGKVADATREYRQGEDTIAQFVDECCEVGPDYHVFVADAYEAYQAFGGAVNKVVFGRRMAAKYLRGYRDRRRVYIGLRLVEPRHE